VRAGEVHALIGENGAGKSTLMKVLSGALAPDAGELRLDGAPYAPRSPADGLARGVAMIYQELSLAPHLSATENILLGAQPRAAAWSTGPRPVARARAALAEVGRDDIASTRRSRGSRAPRRSSSRSRAPSPAARACSCSTSRPRASAARTRRGCSR
jgi:ABC-type sugar transport system ATPase subunit